MDWHKRYEQQAGWTRSLREYLFEKAGFSEARHVLEAGCGTGAILETIHQNPGSSARIFGVDISHTALQACRLHASHAHLVCGDVQKLPFPDHLFDMVFCHYLLLWVKDPLQALKEMKRCVIPHGAILALAEPDYLSREDRPTDLARLGILQNEALRCQGADIGLGSRLADLFRAAGIRIIETGALQNGRSGKLPLSDWENEWEVLEQDLRSRLTPEELNRMKTADRSAWDQGERILNVPTYFAWGQV